MTMIRLRNKSFEKVAASAAVAILATLSAVAQSNSTDNTNMAEGMVKLDKFVVTGSHIAAAAGEQPAIPVTTIDSSQLEISGEAINTMDLLRKILPSMTGIGQENATINTAATYGGSDINLHGMAVLVLVNGRRVATSAAESVGGNRFVDLNMIPASAISKVEVVSDGASAIYGSDAVGGVINVILKSDYNGWGTGAHYGYAPSKGRYSERSAYLTGGVSNENTSIMVSFEYSKHDPLYFSARPYTNPYYASEYYPGIIDIYDLSTNNDEDYMLNPKYNAPPPGGQYSIDQLVNMGYYIDLGSDGNSSVVSQIQKGFNLAEHQTLISNLVRKNLVVNATHKIFGESLEGFLDVMYSNTNTTTTLNAQPIYPYVSTPYTDSWYVGETPPPPGTQYVPVTIPGNPFSSTWIDQAGDGNTGFGVDAHNRFVAYPRIFNNDSTLSRLNGGFRGKINDDYSWEIGGSLSRYDLSYTNQNVINTQGFLDALVAGDLNPFAINQNPGILPGKVLGTAWAKGTSSLGEGDVVFRGTPVALPGGKLAFAVGASYSRELLLASADLYSEIKGWLNSPSVLPINKQRKITAYFAELQVPIVGKDQQIPGVYTAAADFAVRTEHYTTVGNSTVPKVSLRYLPIDDQLSLRFSANKSFVAPTLYDLYGPVNVGSSQSINYTPNGSTTPQSNVQFESSSGSNTALQPSKASTWSAGIGYTPNVVPGLSITIDYFQTHQSGLFGYPDQQTIVQSVENLGTASPYLQFVHFGSATGPTATKPGDISGHPKGAVWLVVPLVNLGGTVIKGFDATASFETKTHSFGRFEASTTISAYNSFQVQLMPTQPFYNYVGTSSQQESTVARWKDYSTFTWKYGNFSVDLADLYVPTVQDVGPGGEGSTTPVDVSSYNQIDAAVGYDFKGIRYFDGLALRIGCNNVFNKMPPIALNSQTETNADVGYYGGAVGRMVYLDATYKF